MLAIWPGVIGKVGVRGIVGMWTAFPGEMATLLSYAVFNSDVAFAAVFVLAAAGDRAIDRPGPAVISRDRRIARRISGAPELGSSRGDGGALRVDAAGRKI